MSAHPRIRKKFPIGCLIPAGLIFFLVGGGIAFFAWTKVLTRVAEVRRWVPTPCQVTSWEVEVTPDAKEGYHSRPVISYQYEFSGQTRTGTVYDAASGSGSGINQLEEEGVTARHGPAICYVNPAAPEESSFIRPGFLLGGALLGTGLLLAGIGLLLLLGALIGMVRRSTGTTGGSVRQGCAGTFLAPIFFAVFAIAGFAVWKLALADQPDWDLVGSRMVPVPGRILASGISSHRSSGKNPSTTYKARVAWEFEFEGRTWRSGWVDFDRGARSSSNSGKANSIVGKYPAGAAVSGWVDPSAPWRAVLEKTQSSSWWLWLFPIVFGGVGVLGLLGWLFKMGVLGMTLARK